ncbi:hypothetical protein EGW08_015981 [Elysia chlorotica]|uniref:Fibrinogen C-terminal domain-containing protein n=1 Tax=Elysia chlorotica TaxID=188477 RepID=A0A3S0ZVJ0_ELYCH|nr:hypothetical protein EGW08_015981 [Elysia chlorotica]
MTRSTKHCLCLWLALASRLQLCACVLSDVRFSRRPCCGVNQDSSCYSQTTTARSNLGCLSSCSQSPSCDSALFVSATRACYLNYACVVDSTCASFHPDLFRYQRAAPCLNGGQMDVQNGGCDCSGTAGYAGDLCQHHVTSCQELATSGAVLGVHPVTMDLHGDGSYIFQTHCVLSSRGTSFTFMRSSGRVAKRFSWSDYVNGFRINGENYWVGLDNLHRYTSDGRNHRVRFGVAFNSSAVNGEILESSSNFVVGPASSGYAYCCNSVSNRASSVVLFGTALYLNNFLVGQSGNRFSTPDTDQDGDSLRHCADLAGSGWWFGSCNPSTVNPLGWSYSVLPVPTYDSLIRLPGVDMSLADLASGFQRVYMTLDL